MGTHEATSEEAAQGSDLRDIDIVDMDPQPLTVPPLPPPVARRETIATEGNEVLDLAGLAETSNLAPIELSGSDWIFPPRERQPTLEEPAGRRPTPKIIFSLLLKLLKNVEIENTEFNSELQQESERILVSLGVLQEKGLAGPRVPEFNAAWDRNDLDFYHSEFMRLPGYRHAIEQLKQDNATSFGRRAAVNLTMARTLGQVARLDALVVGDGPLAIREFEAALDRWLPKPGDTLTTEELCRLAADELQLTPYRFELAMQHLWRLNPTSPFQGRTGGSVVASHPENVIVFEAQAYHFRSVAPGELTFGRNGPVRFISRTSDE